MDPMAISGLSVDKRWRFRCLTLVACLVITSLPPTMGQKQPGDDCLTSSRGPGTCRYLNSCPALKNPSKQDICGYRYHRTIYCCQDNPSHQPLPTTHAPQYWSRSTARQPTKTTRLTSAVNPQTETSHLQISKIGSISEAKCQEYARSVETVADALHLLPKPATVKAPKAECHFNLLPLIVGGMKTTVGEFPHMAALGYRMSGVNNYEFLCGGSLISERFVLTAAHCTYIRDGKLSIVRLGELILNNDNDGATPVDFPVRDIILHPDYKARSYYNDIALLGLGRQVTFTSNIRPACLYTQSNINLKKAVATGWGKIGQSTDTTSDILLKVVIDIVPEFTCRQLYRRLLPDSPKLSEGIVPSMVCAGDLKGGKDTCQGDSGGPLQISYEKNRCVHYLVGITSFGSFCGVQNSPGVYTRISSYVPWIESKVWPSK